MVLKKDANNFLTRKDYKIFIFRKNFFVIFLFIYLPIFITIFIIRAILTDFDQASWMYLLYVIFLILVLLKTIRPLLLANNNNNNNKIIINEKSIKEEGEKILFDIPFNKISFKIETKKYIYLYLNSFYALIFPKEKLTQDELEFINNITKDIPIKKINLISIIINLLIIAFLIMFLILILNYL